MSKAESFENECRQRFLGFCILYKMANYHSEKRKYAEAAYDQSRCLPRLARPTRRAMKRCSTCRKELPLEAFNLNRARRDGRHTQCKGCVSSQGKAWRSANPERKRAQRANEKKRTPADYHRYNIKKYGLTPEDYELMEFAQQGLCAICRRACWRKLSVDHDHETGEVRGLLCSGCNLGLGNFEDNQQFLADAVKYLQLNE